MLESGDDSSIPTDRISSPHAGCIAFGICSTDSGDGQYPNICGKPSSLGLCSPQTKIACEPLTLFETECVKSAIVRALAAQDIGDERLHARYEKIANLIVQEVHAQIECGERQFTPLLHIAQVAVMDRSGGTKPFQLVDQLENQMDEIDDR